MSYEDERISGEPMMLAEGAAAEDDTGLSGSFTQGSATSYVLARWSYESTSGTGGITGIDWDGLLNEVLPILEGEYPNDEKRTRVDNIVGSHVTTLMWEGAAAWQTFKERYSPTCVQLIS